MNKKLIFFCIALCMLKIAFMQTPTVTFAPPPAITTNRILNVTLTNTDQMQLITSNKLEFMDVNYSVSANRTQLQIKIFNRSSAGNLTSLRLNNLLGNWTVFKRSNNSLSCQLIMENNTRNFSLLRLDQKTTKFSMIVNFTQAQVRSRLNSTTVNESFGYIRNNLILGQNCQFVSLEGRVHALNITTRSANLSQVPNNRTFRPVAFSPCLRYAIWNNTLFRFNLTTNNYTHIHRFPVHDHYNISNFDNRMIISASRSMPRNITWFNQTANANQNITVQQFNQTVRIFMENMTGLNLIRQINITAFDRMAMHVPILTSPTLSRLAIRYNFFNSSLTVHRFMSRIQIFTIEYALQRVRNLLPENAAALSDIVEGAAQQSSQMLSENFLVLRNQSKCNGSTASGVVCHEVSYEFIGDQLIEIGRRNLVNVNQTNSNYLKVFIDSSYATSNMALSVIKTETGISIVETNYHNFAAKRRIAPPTIPSFLQVEYLNATQNVVLAEGNQLEFNVLKRFSATNRTQVSTFRFNDTFNATGSNMRNASNNLTGVFRAVLSNRRCSLLTRQGVANASFILRQRLANNSQVNYNLSTIFSNIVLASSTFRLSVNCDRLTINRTVYYKVSDTNWTAAPPNINFTWNSMDQNLTYAVVNGSIWKWNNTLLIYTSYHNNTVPLFQSEISVSGPRVTAVSRNRSSTNTTRLFVIVYNDTQRGLKSFFNYSGMYTDQVKVQFSQNLQILVIMGMTRVNETRTNVSSGNTTVYQINRLRVDAFFLNYIQEQQKRVFIPSQCINPFEVSHFTLSNRKYLYIRQVLNLSMINNQSYTAIPRHQCVYLLDQNAIFKRLFLRRLTTKQAEGWQRSVIKVYPNKILLVNGSIENINSTARKIVMKSQQILLLAANISTDARSSGVLASNGTVIRCPPNCRQCTTNLTCDVCSQGFKITAQGRCTKCPPGCIDCDQDNNQICLRCANGTFLNGTICSRCSIMCPTCLGSANSCQSCTNGQFFNTLSRNCSNCTVKNCAKCLNLTFCEQCSPGFVQIRSGLCRQCTPTCSRCNSSNITQCLGCNRGMALVNKTCMRCPPNCEDCNQKLLCSNCSFGYMQTANGTCKRTCSEACRTCSGQNPDQCLTCFGSDILVGKTCRFNIACNATGACSTCGLGLYQVNSYCYNCSDVLNVSSCLKCNEKLQCQVCDRGSYINQDNLCSNCSDSCLNCKSQTVCLQCKQGFIIFDDAAEGKCIACEHPCKTCKATPTSCQSCQPSYNLKGQRCQYNLTIGFKLVFSTNQEAVLNKIDDIVAKILQLMREHSSNTASILIESITTGSVSVAGTATTSSGNVNDASQSLSSGLSGVSNINGLPLASSSIFTNKDEGINEQAAAKVGLIIGLVAGGIIIFGVLVGLIIKCNLKKKNRSLIKVEQLSINERKQIMNNDSYAFQKSDQV